MSQQAYRQQRQFDTMVALGLALLAAVLYLPFIGSYPLWDPWEAHYSQVAMEMVQHNSWWEPWYRNSTRSFWSKPIFTFWLMISSLKTFRIQQVGDFANAEFFLRMPIALMGAIGVAFMYYFVKRLWNRRTGVITALVLATCPQYFLISRQVMVDIPYVVIQLIAMGFFALGVFNLRPLDDDEERKFGIRSFSLLAGLFVAVQVIELAYWRFKLIGPPNWKALVAFNGFAWKREGLNWLITWNQGSVLWITLAGFFAIWAVVRATTRDPAKRAFALFFFVSGLGFLAKGLLSIVVPGGAVLFYILITRDWDLLRRMGLFYNSPRLSNTASIVIGTLASLIAVWFLTYPMMPRVTRDMVNNTNNRLRVARRDVAKLQKVQQRVKGQKSASNGTKLFAKQQTVNYLSWQSRALSSVNTFYHNFRNRMPLHKQVAAFSVVLLVITLLLLLIGGQSWWFGGVVLAGGGLLIGVLTNVARLKLYFAKFPLIFSLLVLAITTVIVTFAWSKEPDWKKARPYFTAFGLLLLVAVLNRFFPFATIMQSKKLSPGLVFFSLFTVTFMASVSILVFLHDRTKQLELKKITVPATMTFLLTALVWLAVASNKSVVSAFGYNTFFSLTILLGIVVMVGLFNGSENREHVKAFYLSGALIYLVVAGSWVFVMCYKHGMPFMREWFIYHHFQRIQGVIEKPNNSFDLYIKQIGFGMFPWSALLPIAIARFLRWNHTDMVEAKSRRNIFFFCCFLFPYFFFTFSSTKFHHYIFPVVPFLAIIAGVWISSLFREDGIRKERMGLAASFLLFVLLAKDLMTNYKPLHQLFTYYTNRQTPGDVYPRNFFLLAFALFGLVFLFILLSRRLRYYQFAFLLVPVVAFVLFVNGKLMPAVAANFSFKSLYEAYKKHDKGRRLPFGEFSNWDERSTSFYTKNFSKFLGRHNIARNFLRRATDARPVFIMVSRHKVPTLRNIARSVGKKLYILERPHYDMWLVSTKQPEGARGVESVRFFKRPALTAPHWRRINIDFGGKARLIAVRLNKPNGYKRGDKVEIRFLFKVTGGFKKDWKVFIHADPVKWTRNRLNWDHEMAEGLYPTSEWKKGEYVQDILVKTLPRNYPSQYSRLNIYMGLWLGSNRVPIKYANVYNDGQNRALPVRLKLLP